MEQVKEAVEAGADIIMLDNMTPEMMKEAVEPVSYTHLDVYKRQAYSISQ